MPAWRQSAKGKGRVAQAVLRFFRFVFSLVFLGTALLPAGGARAQQKTATKKPAASRTSAEPAAKKASTKTSTKKSKKGRKTSRSRAQKAPAAERILEIQTALARTSHFGGEPTGKWDASSVAAMKSFQQAQGLKVTGKIDAASLQKLGLGSQTAGVAAPRPSVSATDSSTRNR